MRDPSPEELRGPLVLTDAGYFPLSNQAVNPCAHLDTVPTADFDNPDADPLCRDCGEPAPAAEQLPSYSLMSPVRARRDGWMYEVYPAQGASFRMPADLFEAIYRPTPGGGS